MIRRANLKSITILVIFFMSFFYVQTQSVSGRGTRNIRPETQQIELLNSETIEQSIENLYLPDLFYRSRSGAEGITLPLPKTIGMEDIGNIITNQRFAKLINELSKIDNEKSGKLIVDEINKTLPIYLQMFSDSWDKVLKAHENEPLDQRQTIGPSLQYNDPNGEPTLAGLRLKLMSLIVLTGNLNLESTRPAIAKVITEAIAQRNKFYDPNTGFEGDRYSMLTKAGLYNRQVLATGILLTDKNVHTNIDTTYSEENIWQTIFLAKDETNAPYLKVIPGNHSNVLNITFLKPIDDEEFDKICKEQNTKFSINQVSGTQGNELKGNIEINPVPNQEVLILDTDDIVEILSMIGFSKSQITENALKIHDGLSKSGAVRIIIDDEVEAGLAVKGDEVYINSRNHGYHIYNIKTGWTNPTAQR